ncbi:MAG: hypothetical protein ABSA12_09015 [Verrucomicrobiia bacterium]
MSLLKMIDEIDALITNGTKPAAIKAKLYALREQAQALDGELSTTKAKYDQLEARHNKAVADRQKVEADLKQQIAALKEAQSPPVAASGAPGDLNEVEVKILQLVSQRAGIGAGLIGHHLQISRTKAEYLADKLVSDGYLHDLIFLGQPKEYELEERGREYLVRHGLA